MSDPSLALQEAIGQALAAALAGPPVSGRIFDRAPPGATFPYVTLGAVQALNDEADCVDGMESFTDIHVWSEEVGYDQTKRIADLIRSTLHHADLTLTDHALVEMTHRQTRYMRDPDGLTSHAVVEIRALTEFDP